MPLKSSSMELKFLPAEIISMFKGEVSKLHNVPESQIEVHFDIDKGYDDHFTYKAASLKAIRVIIKNPS